MKSSREEVEAILKDLRIAFNNNKIIPIARDKNIKTLARLGITWDIAKEEISTLTYSNYIKGPEIDYDRPKEDSFWIFKKVVQGEIIYIKFKVLYKHNSEVTLVSFHFDEV